MQVNIDSLLKEKQKTRYWLSKKVGIAYQNLCNLAENETTSIRFEILERICIALDCTPNDILKIEKNK